MPPQSRGNGQPLKPSPAPAGFQSKSTPNLPTLRSFNTTNSADSEKSNATLTTSEQASPDIITSPSEPASIDDFSLDSTTEPPSLSPASAEDDDDDETDSASDNDHNENEDSSTSKLPARSYSHHHYSRSQNHLWAPQAFAPPFYGRPPTPLPPSPSLTSLLRPTFSSNFNSRPTTPDPSSDEGGNTTPATREPATGTQTPNSAAASTLTSTYRSAKPIPRASPKVPTYEYYGFTLYLASSLAFIVYLLWSFLPSPFLHQLGIYYYPNRWWALAIPAWTVMFVIYIYVALAGYNTGYLTLSMKSVECVVDEAANVAVVDGEGRLVQVEMPSWHTESSGRHGKKEKGKEKGREKSGKKKGRSRHNSTTTDPGLGFGVGKDVDWRVLWAEGTDAVMDIPIGGVCEILYGQHSDTEDISGNAHDR